MGESVPPICERVQDEILDAPLPPEGDQGVQMLERGMHSPVGDQSEQVHPTTGGDPEGLREDVVPREPPARHGLVDPQQILRHHRPRPQVQVAHLAVPHLPCRQPHRHTRRLQRRVRVTPPQLLEDLRPRQ